MGAFTMELEKINNSIVSEKNRTRQEKENKKAIQSMLFNYFYKQFKLKSHDFEKLYFKYQYINEREKILKQLSDNDSFTFQYLNTIYTKTLKEVYEIFKNNYKFIQEQERQEELQILTKDLQKVLFIKQEQEKKQKQEKIKAEQDRKKQENFNLIFNILQYTFSIPRNHNNIINIIFISVFYWIFCTIKT